MPLENSGEIACAVKSCFSGGGGYRFSAEQQLFRLVYSEKGEIISKAFAEAALEKAAKVAMIVRKRYGGVVGGDPVAVSLFYKFVDVTRKELLASASYRYAFTA